MLGGGRGGGGRALAALQGVTGVNVEIGSPVSGRAVERAGTAAGSHTVERAREEGYREGYAAGFAECARIVESNRRHHGGKRD